MIADVSLSLKSEESSYLIPKSALADTNRGIYVMSVIDGVTKKTIVRKKRDNGMMTEITGDLNGISVILKNVTEDIKDGIPVNTVDI